MKKVNVILLFATFCIVFSCKKESVLDATFDCSTKRISNSERVTDFKKNFSIVIPKKMKKELYYNSFQSEIFAADTTKQLSETFIIKISNNSGQLIYNDKFFKSIDSLSKIQEQILVESQIEPFKEKEMYWNVYKSTKKGFTFHQFNSYIKIANDSFINSVIEIYGDEKINERLCEAISILKTIEF